MSYESFHTICIVGAGPGGTYTALQLAKLGIPCTLIDKAIFPRDKVCGESIPSVAIKSLHRLNPAILDEPEFRSAKQIISGVNLYAPNGKKIYIPFNSKSNELLGLDSCIGIRRLDFDQVLMRFAKREKCITVMEETEVKRVEKVANGFKLFNQLDEPLLNTNMLVVANGFNSNLTRQLTNWNLDKGENASGIASYFTQVEGISNTGLAECYVLSGLQSGGLYIQPVGNGVVNVNISIHNDVRKKYGVNIRKVLDEAIQSQPVLKKRFEHAVEIRKPLGHGYHLGIEKRPVCGDHFLLVGDAAGFNDALTANGIGHAMKSAEVAANHIAKAYSKNDFSQTMLFPYQTEVYNLFSSVRITGKVGSWAMKYPSFIFFIMNTFFGYKWIEELAFEVMYTKYPVVLVVKMPVRWLGRWLRKLVS
ncbi:MAG: NAD(P)/FAD-dependent oxidoreductase [Bacteroidia bacterium]|nr:NAD(P)/FAD-dependent oxidoreductase [Bacteroidia bacterium]